MEEWLASYKDICPYNLGESGMPDISVGEVMEKCGLSPVEISDITLKDNDTRGTIRLREAIAETYDKNIGADNITVTTGTSEALFILYNLLLEKRTSVVVPFPSFQALYEIPRALGSEIRFYNLAFKKSFIPEPDEICSLIDDTTGIVIINSPHNPSGILFPDKVAEKVIKKAAYHGAYVIADEHYRFLPLNGNHPLKSFAEPEENVIATGSITKCFGMPGLRVGWITAHEKMIKKICGFRDYLTHTLSPVSDYLAAAVLENKSVFLEKSLPVLHSNLKFFSDMADNTPGLSYIKPEGGVVAFPKYEYHISSDDFAEGLIKKTGVFVLPGSSFETENHFRINFGHPSGIFTEAVSLINEYCNGLQRKI